MMVIEPTGVQFALELHCVIKKKSNKHVVQFDLISDQNFSDKEFNDHF